jgi:hypothetical protein
MHQAPITVTSTGGPVFATKNVQLNMILDMKHKLS